MLELNQASIIYQAQLKLIELVKDIALNRSFNRVKDKFYLAAKLRYYLKALALNPNSDLTLRRQILQQLIELCNINSFALPPLTTNFEAPTILIGIPGPPGPPGSGGGGSAGVKFQNTDIDSPSEVVDAFPVSAASGVFYSYTLNGTNIGEGRRAGTIIATWASGSVTFQEFSTDDLNGSTDDCQLSVDINGGNVRLVATVDTNNWVVRGNRTYIYEI
jgi:hypothetical protein